MKNKAAVVIIFTAILAALACGQGPVRPVPMLMNDIAIREAVYFRENGQYADFDEIPEVRADLTRIDEEGYTWFYSLEFKNDKIIGYKFQTWKDRDCDTGGQMSYFIQQKDILRYRCSTDGSMANETDQKVE